VVFMRDLQRSRERLLVTREQERQRLREDLHDGLGPTLAGVALGLESARRQMAGGAVASELADLSSDVELALDDLKRIVAELRPAALDELGLVDALKQYAQALDASSPMRVSVRMGGRLPDLPTSHELAAYFIAREAMNNAVRHSAGTSCEVSVRWADGLHVRVRDDGAGLPAEPRPGVGLDSMRRRARALGGECRVGPPQRGGGTEVTLWLPTTS
jgi:signal transduction histidine kinase